MPDEFDELARVDELAAGVAAVQTSMAQSAGRPQEGDLFRVQPDGSIADRFGKELRGKLAPIVLNTKRPEG